MRQLRCRGRDRPLRLVVLHHKCLAGELREIDDDIGTLGRGHHEIFHRNGLVPHTALGSDLPEVWTTNVEVEDPSVTAVQDPEPVHARLDVEEWPDLAVNEYDVAEVLPDPNHAVDVTRRIQERSVRIELAILDNQRNLVCSARDADRVGFQAGVIRVAKNIGGGEASEDIQTRRSQAVVMEREQRGRHFGQLVGVVDGLGLPLL